MSIPKDTTIRSLFFEPLFKALLQSKCQRSCSELSDEEWLKLGVFRVNGQESSGRSHLQRMANYDIIVDKNRQTVEAAFASGRRCRLAKDITANLLGQLQDSRPDPFKDIAGLDVFDIYAADGHYHRHALFDKYIDGKKRPVQHFYALNLRTSGMSHLTTARIGDDDTDIADPATDRQKGTPRKTENDLHALKRLSAMELRQGAPSGRKVLYVYDRAIIDFAQWNTWKMQDGIYVISRSRDNLKFNVIKPCVYKKNNPINSGIISCDIVTGANGVRLRRITQRLPENGTDMTFLTNDLTLDPGVIAYLYKRRWDIEKVFDVLKNKLNEKQAWGKNISTKDNQAHMICIHHNLIVLLEKHIDMESIQHTDKQRARKRLKRITKESQMRGDDMPELRRIIIFITQHSKKLLGWLRACLELNKPLKQATASLQKLLEATY